MYKTRSILKTIIFSIPTTIILYLIILTLSQKKNKQKAESKIDAQNIENLTNSFLITSKKKTDIYLKKIFKIYNSSKLMIAKDNINYHIINHLNRIGLTKNDLIEILQKNTTNQNLIILCIKSNEETSNFIKEIHANVEIITINQLYHSIIKNSENPSFLINFQKQKLKLKDIYKIAITKAHSLKFFLFGIVTLFMSFFTFYKLYYLIFSTFLFFLSILSLYSKNNKTNQNPFNFKQLITDENQIETKS